MKSLGDHSAGREFDVCVVVNQESGRPLNIPNLPFPVSELSRPNVGMNIGAWDHGWRKNPGYGFYIFLQDECVILRNEWLQAMVECLMDPSIGIVGECINHRWCKPWSELTRAGLSEPQDGTKSLTAQRAALCLQFMQTRNIPAGETGRHLRSLIWGFSGDVLGRLGGFPIGESYDECIAVEIAVNRQVEGLGLAVRQANRMPLYHVGHTQWIRTYPGFSSSLSYEVWARRRLSEPSFPFLSFMGRSEAATRIDQLVKRVETERGLFDGGVIRAPKRGFFGLLVVFIDRAPTDADLALTVVSWSLQSAPSVDIILVATEKFLLDKVKAWMSRPEHEHFSQSRACLFSEWIAEDLEGYQFIFFARAGDQFHPSAASAVTLLSSAENPDIVIWNEKKHRRFERGAWLFRQPRLEPLTIQIVGHVGMGFAVRPRWIKEFPDNFSNDLLNNDSHLFHLWLSRNPQIRWITHPEFLTSRLLPEKSPLEVSPPAHGNYRKAYREILGETGKFQVLPSPNSDRTPPLLPSQRARSTSIIISFRDRPQETIACLKSLLGQELSGHLEVVLINNRSQEECLEEVRRLVETSREAGSDIKLINYDGPFNHSRQTNFGARNSSGEVLVFLNNDAELMEARVLEEMTSWALVSGVGTVGCQIVGPQAQLLSAGIRARSTMTGLSASPVEESREVSYSGRVREVLANTFACAAIARSKFDKVGWLNETEFPNGYNDVEYGLRLNQRGYRNVYLGHLQVKHTPGTSRGRCDEGFQKILLRRRYPELSVDGMYHLSYEWRPEDPADNASVIGGPAVVPATEAELPVGLKRALKVLYKAVIYWVQRRILRTA
jgi:GT2 family glycosyltransferase